MVTFLCNHHHHHHAQNCYYHHHHHYHITQSNSKKYSSKAEHALDEVGDVCRFSLQTLKIVNISRLSSSWPSSSQKLKRVKDNTHCAQSQDWQHVMFTNIIARLPFSMMAVSAFRHLRCLIISPHNLGDDLVEALAGLERLRNLHIVSNAYTEPTPTPVDYRVWRALRKAAPKIRVHLVTEGKHKKEVVFQTRAPVKSVVYDTPYTRATQYSMDTVVDLYRTDLEVYCHSGLPRFHRQRGFVHRPDSAYLSLASECPYLHTLMIRERISSSTVLLLAFTAKNLRYFYVRRNAIILKCDWKQKEVFLSLWPHSFPPLSLNLCQKTSLTFTLATGLVRRVLLLGEEKQPQLQRYGERGLTGNWLRKYIFCHTLRFGWENSSHFYFAAGAWLPMVCTQRQAVQANHCQFELSILLRGIWFKIFYLDIFFRNIPNIALFFSQGFEETGKC